MYFRKLFTLNLVLIFKKQTGGNIFTKYEPSAKPPLIVLNKVCHYRIVIIKFIITIVQLAGPCDSTLPLKTKQSFNLEHFIEILHLKKLQTPQKKRR